MGPISSFDSNNQLTSTNARGLPSTPSYDASGDVLSGGANQYLYDAEGRICAVWNSVTGSMTGYIYDADGNRVSKGTIGAWSCNPTTAQFQTESDYILDLGGQQMSEYAMQPNGAMAWQHTNVWAAGRLIATYAQDSTSSTPNTLVHFYLDDPLGSRRVQTDIAGNVEQTCANLPYGDGESCPPTPTEHLFTGKERDAESGNDYFGARYYASTMGRFLSPDKPFADQHSANPQSWNLYSYTRNNPLRFVDDDGEAVKETSDTVHYHVSGKTATEAWNNAPAASGIAGGFRGNTDWSIGVGHYDFDRSLQSNNGSQTVTDTVTSGDVNLNVTITLPEWDGYSSASPEEQKQWDSLSGNLQSHENGHKDIAEKNADSLDKSLPGTKATGTSDTVPDAVKKADSALGDTLHDKQNTTVNNTKQQQQTYDKKTNHGDN